jgi:ribosome maturation factor RimP
MDEEIIERVKALADSYLSSHSIELVDVIYRRESPGMVLRLLVDTHEGITIEQCEKLNQHLSEVLDKENVIEDHYVLEVSSPGLDRPLKTDRDFDRVIGKELIITTFEPIEGKRTLEGKLISCDKEKIVIDALEKDITIPRNKIAKATLDIDF